MHQWVPEPGHEGRLLGVRHGASLVVVSRGLSPDTPLRSGGAKEATERPSEDVQGAEDTGAGQHDDVLRSHYACKKPYPAGVSRAFHSGPYFTIFLRIALRRRARRGWLRGSPSLVAQPLSAVSPSFRFRWIGGAPPQVGGYEQQDERRGRQVERGPELFGQGRAPAQKYAERGRGHE